MSIGHFLWKSTWKVTILWEIQLTSENPLENATEHPLDNATENPLLFNEVPISVVQLFVPSVVPAK